MARDLLGAAWPGESRHGAAWQCETRQDRTGQGKGHFIVTGGIATFSACRGGAWLGLAGRGKTRQGSARVFFLRELSMKTCTVTIEGVSPISFSAPVKSLKKQGETHDAYEERTWRERAHINSKGEMFVPPGALKGCLQDAARYLSESVPGKGKSTYTKHFEAGVMVTQPLMLGVQLKDCECDRVFVPSDGKPGGGKRVWKSFPLLQNWITEGEIIVLDPVIEDKTEKVREYLEYAGKLIGIGRYRPRNRGFYGRFRVVDFKVS